MTAKKPTKQKPNVRPVSSGNQRTTVLVPQPHGGALRVGGKPGNAGGGRPPETIRASMRESLDELLPDVLARYKKGELDHIRVAEFLAKYGLGTKDEISVTDHPKFREAVSIIRNELALVFGEEAVDAAILSGQAKLNAR